MKTLVFKPGPGFDVDTHTREGTWQRLGGNADAIREGGDTVELDWVLNESVKITGPM